MNVIEVTLFDKKWTPTIKTRFDNSVLRVKNIWCATKIPLRTVSSKQSDTKVWILCDTHTRELEGNLRELQQDKTFPLFVYETKQKIGWKCTSKHIASEHDYVKLTTRKRYLSYVN